MCGVCGVLYKTKNAGKSAPVGVALTEMLATMAHRGEDSTGITVANHSEKTNFIVRLWAEDVHGAKQHIGDAATVHNISPIIDRINGNFIRVLVKVNQDQAIADQVKTLSAFFNQVEGVTLHSIGNVSEVIKDTGTAEDLDLRHSIRAMSGSHGIGHVRLATESRVDITHSHPFWAYPFADVTVVHNGQLTNYHKLRRKYETGGHKFLTGNDSELISVYLADKLSRGLSLHDSLTGALSDLDGTFTFLVATSDSIGYAKDRWAAKPLVIREDKDIVAIASEEVALDTLGLGESQQIEPQENEVMTWSI